MGTEGTTPSTEEILAARGKTHGDYSVHAGVTQALKRIVVLHHQHRFTCEQMEGLDMILHKIGRIVAGDPDFRDHWDDIAGYAKMVAQRCSK